MKKYYCGTCDRYISSTQWNTHLESKKHMLIYRSNVDNSKSISALAVVVNKEPTYE